MLSACLAQCLKEFKSLVDLRRLQHRLGQDDVLYMTEGSSVAQHMESTDSPEPYVCPCTVETYSKYFTSLPHLQEFEVGSFCSIAIKVIKAVPKQAKDGGDYLLVSGIDCEQKHIPGACLWRFEENDLEPFRIYILRGVTVRIAQCWSDAACESLDREDEEGFPMQPSHCGRRCD